MTFVKERADAPHGFFEWEAAGLAWLAEAEGARCVRVLDVDSGRIVLERLTDARPTAADARAFGAALARTHDAAATAFGAPPPDWTGPAFIGNRRMPCVPTPTWGRFYAEQRIRPFLDPAVRAGNLTASARRSVDAACALIDSGAFDDDEPPARLHGDLWAGNVVWTDGGAVLIDPAAHGGHRETDLAMLALFGAPDLDEILVGYESVHPLRAGWRSRVPLHQLHPLAVHAAGHSPSYGVALERAALSTLALV
ncbi:fructosamine kinase family protein [Microbacteriaceae bacterium VKM Ac-2854]|nr:fructosamine kinase family protein [Microbacteriaceae bacterium VKM Ac-2854]